MGQALFVRWTVAASLGFAAGLAAAFPIGFLVDYGDDVAGELGVGLVMAVAGAVMGALVGAAQTSVDGLAVRRMPWIIASTLGMAIGVPLFIAFVAIANRNPPLEGVFGGMLSFGMANSLAYTLRLAVAWVALGLITGFALGLAQWTVLRGYAIRVGAWVLGVAASMVLAMLLGGGARGIVASVWSAGNAESTGWQPPPTLPELATSFAAGMVVAGLVFALGTRTVLRLAKQRPRHSTLLRDRTINV